MIPFPLLMTSPDPVSWDRPERPRALEGAFSVALASLERSAAGREEPAPAALAVAACAARIDRSAAADLLRLSRRSLVHLPPNSEPALRCLRAIAHAGGAVDLSRLRQALSWQGRPSRLALSALADLAANGDDHAFVAVVSALHSPLCADAAQLLSSLCSDASVDVLANFIRAPGLVGVHAAAALLSAEDDPFAFESLCERLCLPREAAQSARALFGAAPGGRHLQAAEAVLARWTRRGVHRAEPGRMVASVALTAAGLSADAVATFRALGSDDDEVVLLGTQAAWQLGDTERARLTAVALMRRGPTLAGAAFALLVRWADCGDRRALEIVRGALERRPVDLARSSALDALASAKTPAIAERAERALRLKNPGVALDAARSIARAHEPPSIVPGVWL